jgi:hypothetical protein
MPGRVRNEDKEKYFIAWYQPPEIIGRLISVKVDR